MAVQNNLEGTKFLLFGERSPSFDFPPVELDWKTMSNGITEVLMKDMNRKSERIKKKEIELVDCIIQDPKVVLKWSDGTVTVVEAQEGDKFSAEAGFALAYLKKSCGNTGRYNDLMKQWINKKDNEKKAKEEEKAKLKKNKEIQDTVMKKLKREQKEETERKKEEQIQMQTEAFERAIRNLVNSGDIELPSFIKNLLRK